MHMLKTLTVAVVVALALIDGALAALPIRRTIDWSLPIAPELTAYQANELTIEWTVKNKEQRTDIRGYEGIVYWATTNTATGVVSATCSVTSGTQGVFRSTWSTTQLNTNGVYMYGVGLSSNGVPTIARQGVLRIIADPYSAPGAGALSLQTNCVTVEVDPRYSTSVAARITAAATQSWWAANGGGVSESRVVAATNDVPAWIDASTSGIPAWVSAATSPIPSWISAATGALQDIHWTQIATGVVDIVDWGITNAGRVVGQSAWFLNDVSIGGYLYTAGDAVNWNDSITGGVYKGAYLATTNKFLYVPDEEARIALATNPIPTWISASTQGFASVAYTNDFIGLVNGLSVRDPVLTLAVDSTGPYATVTPSPAGQIEYWFGNAIVQYGTSVVVRLTAGTTNTPTLNYICAMPNGTISNFTSYPYLTSGTAADARALMFEVFLMDTNSIAAGTGYALRSWTENVENRRGLGRVSWMGERIRRQPAIWESGVQASLDTNSATTNAVSGAYITTSSGVGWQMHSHTIPANTNLTAMWILNSSVGFRGITNLAQITHSPSGVAVLQNAGDAYAINVFAFVESGITPKSTRIMLALASQDYTVGSTATKLANAISDSSSYDVTGVPVWMQGMTIRLARIVVQRNTSGTTRIYRIYDRRGQPLGTAGGGASSSGESDPVWTAVASSYATNAGGVGDGYFAMSGGVWKAFSGGVIGTETDPVWSAASNSLLETQQGYIKDMWVDYWTTNMLSIWPGSAMCAGKYVASSTSSYIVVNTMTRSNEIQYVYLNRSASSFAGCTYYTATNVPIYATNTWWGWYSPATNTDRCVGWAVTYTNSYHLTTFARSQNGECGMQFRWCGLNMNPDGTYQTPTPYQTSTFLGVTAVEGSFRSRAAYSATDGVLFEAVPSEYSTLPHEYQYISDTQVADWNHSFWLRLGPSKNVLIKGNNLNANALSIGLFGYKEIR